MLLFWVLFWSVLPALAFSSGPDCRPISESSSSQGMFPLLESLQCYNDYESHVHCWWKKHTNTTMKLWFKTADGRKLCEPYDAPDATDGRTVHCRYKTRVFAIGVKHTVFFLKNNTPSVCSPDKQMHLLHHLRARPPVNLSTEDVGDGGRRILWSSPYLSSSSLNENLTYQLSYRTHRQDSWTTDNVTTTTVKLEKHVLLPGHRYEARVRARASVGQWSDWSPVVTWQTKDAVDFGQLPTLHCVLDGEREVVCSWEVSRELAHFITYQLACRHNQTAPSERCCVNPTVSPYHSGTVLKYSCSLTVASPEHLLLQLQPTRNVKTFKAYQHIRPKPPQQLKVREENGNWIVEWIEPSKRPTLFYQVYYYRTQDQRTSVLLNTSERSTYEKITGTSLDPFQSYQVKVRSLVAPGYGPEYEGIPSEWTDPVEWTSNGATWSPTTLIYTLISVFVAAIFLILYCTIPACQRKVILWVDSVPSPGKSKILSEMKSATSGTLMQSEKTSICKVQRLDSVSTCSSDALLWPTKVTEKDRLDQNQSCCNCDTLPCPAEKVKGSDTSSMSFSGPYIFCQSSEQTSKSVSIKSEDKGKETPSDVPVSPSSANFTVFGDGYVHLPNPNITRSTQDLVSCSNDNTSTHFHDSTEQDLCGPDGTLWPVKPDNQPGLSEPTSRDQPPEYTSEPFTAWPQMDAVQASGYCHLPTAFMTAAK